MDSIIPDENVGGVDKDVLGVIGDSAGVVCAGDKDVLCAVEEAVVSAADRDVLRLADKNELGIALVVVVLTKGASV